MLREETSDDDGRVLVLETICKEVDDDDELCWLEGVDDGATDDEGGIEGDGVVLLPA